MTTRIFLGVDIGSQEHVCAALDDERQVLWEGRIDNTHEGCAALVRRVQDWQRQGFAVWAGAEGFGGYASPLDVSLCAAGCLYLNVNPVQVKRYRELTNWQPDKTDERDARLLADYTHWRVDRGDARALQVQDSYFHGLKQLARAAQQIMETKVTLQNELVSTVRVLWPELVRNGEFFSHTDSIGFLTLLSRYPTPHAVQRAGAAKLKQVLRQACRRSMEELAKRLVQSARAIVKTAPEDVGRTEVIRTLAQTLIRLVESLSDFERRLEEQLQKHPFGMWLLDQEGIGPRTAGSVLGEAGDFRRYAGEAQLARYGGHGANVSQSGKRDPIYFDSHRYNHRLKRALLLMAQSRAQHHGPSIAFKKKRLAQGIGYWKVMKQLARHLIRFLCKNWEKVVNNLWVDSWDSSAAVNFS